jgi:pilus assembly protein Flp/PilA
MLDHLLHRLSRHRDETGASSVEYGLLATAIAALLVVILWLLGGVVTELFADSCTTIDNTLSTSADCS